MGNHRESRKAGLGTASAQEEGPRGDVWLLEAAEQEGSTKEDTVAVTAVGEPWWRRQLAEETDSMDTLDTTVKTVCCTTALAARSAHPRRDFKVP